MMLKLLGRYNTTHFAWLIPFLIPTPHTRIRFIKWYCNYILAVSCQCVPLQVASNSSWNMAGSLLY